MATPNPNPVPSGNAEVTPFLHKVGAPLVWIAVGYLIATVTQRPRRSP